MTTLPALVSAPRRQHFEAWTHDQSRRALAFASSSEQVRRYFAKAWGVKGTQISVGSRPDLNKVYDQR